VEGTVLIVCWAAKGGSGTSVVTAVLGLVAPPPVLLVDLDGDLPHVLGLTEPPGAGVLDWVASAAEPSALARLRVPVRPGVELLAAGEGRADPSAGRWADLGAALRACDGTVVADAGTGAPPLGLVERADRRLLVTRPCFLALRRATGGAVHPTGVILVEEPGRALRRDDVEHALAAPVVAEVSVDPAVARAVDAGLLRCALPRGVRSDLRSVAA
jgi:hypothetical protein